MIVLKHDNDRTWFGGIQLQEVSGGDFVIVSDDLYDEFETFTYSRGHEKGYVPYRLNYVLRNESYRFHVVYT